MDATAPATFQVADYVVFALMLAISSCVGLFYAIREARQRRLRDAQDYISAKRKIHYIPVALSLTVSFMSAITILGNPAEIYTYGMMLWWLAPAFFIAAAIISEIYIPVFYRLDITSSYEYLERRFNRVVRVLVTAAFIVETVMYAGIVIYAPSLALSQVTGLDLWTAVLSTGLVCTFYTTLGGLKGVIWTDVFQMVVILTGLLAVIIRGSVITDGGFTEIWRINGEGGRLNMRVVDPDPKVRHSIWTLLVGGTFLWLGLYAVSQSQVQRYLCCRTERESKIALFINSFGLLVIITFTCLTGLVLYSQYHLCDPIVTGKFSAAERDRLLPFLVMDIFRDYPGIPGVFVACVYSGGLSTMSTGINAMACVTVEDIIKPFSKLSDKAYGWISRGLGLIYGLICIGMAYLASELGAILQAAISIFGIVGGPLIGVYTLGIMFAFANSLGAAAGLLIGLGCTSWLYNGAVSYRAVSTAITNALPPGNTTGCPTAAATNQTTSYFGTTTISTTIPDVNITAATTQLEVPAIIDFYSVSYLYYGCIGFAVTLGIGIIVSLSSCGWRQRKMVHQELLRPPFDHWLFRSWLPEKVRRVLRFDVDWSETPEFSTPVPTVHTEISAVSDGKMESDSVMVNDNAN